MYTPTQIHRLLPFFNYHSQKILWLSCFILPTLHIMLQTVNRRRMVLWRLGGLRWLVCSFSNLKGATAQGREQR
jgi:hypothetical protein